MATIPAKGWKMEPLRLSYYREVEELIDTLLTTMVLTEEKLHPEGIPYRVQKQLEGAQKLCNRTKNALSSLNDLRHEEAKLKEQAAHQYRIGSNKVLEKCQKIKIPKKGKR